MDTSHNTCRTRVAIVAILVLVLIAAVCIIVYHGQNEPLRYEGVKGVTLQLDYPPFTTFSLSNAETNTLLDALSSINFSETQEDVPMGDGVTCTIATDTDTYTIGFLRPYCITGRNLYVLDNDAEVFKVVEQIVVGHQ